MKKKGIPRCGEFGKKCLHLYQDATGLEKGGESKGEKKGCRKVNAYTCDE
jgi:hypothetical protein